MLEMKIKHLLIKQIEEFSSNIVRYLHQKISFLPQILNSQEWKLIYKLKRQ